MATVQERIEALKTDRVRTVLAQDRDQNAEEANPLRKQLRMLKSHHLKHPFPDIPFDLESLLINNGPTATNLPAVVLLTLADLYLTLHHDFDAPWATYEFVDGAEGEDALAWPSEMITGESGIDVIFGRNGMNGGHDGRVRLMAGMASASR